jgi:hypothetical protein
MKSAMILGALLLVACSGDGSSPGASSGTGGGAGAIVPDGGSGGQHATGGGGQGGIDEPDELVCDGPGPRFATHVVDVSYGPGQNYGRDFMPDIALGPPVGGGCCTGSLDVVSLGNGGAIVLGFAGNGIVDGPGVDFVVFENAFEFGESTFAEVATVEVSADGITWVSYPCDALEPPWGSCAGHQPVHLGAAALAADGSFDPGTSGGDGFDLAEVGLEQVRWVRIVDRSDQEGFQGVFDLDAVGIVHAACP